MMTKKTLYYWHRKLGLTIGAILFLLGVSGTILVFRDELLPVLYPDLLSVTPQATRAPLEQQFRAIRAYAPNTRLNQYYNAEDDHTGSLVLARPDGAWLPHMIAIDPYTAEVRGSMPLAQNIFGVMLYLHANLFLGKIGGYVVGVMGLILVGFFVSGLILWWPKSNWARKLEGLKHGARGLHRSLGLFLGLPIAFSAITGVMLAFDLIYIFGRFTGDAAKPEEVVQVKECAFEDELRTLDKLTAEQQANLVSFHFCSKKNGLTKLTYGQGERSGHHGFTRILVDPATQTVVQKFDSQKDPWSWSANSLWTYPLHTWESFGLIGRWVNVLTGIGLAVLFLTGLWPTLQRRRHRKNLSKM